MCSDGHIAGFDMYDIILCNNYLKYNANTKTNTLNTNANTNTNTNKYNTSTDTKTNRLNTNTLNWTKEVELSFDNLLMITGFAQALYFFILYSKIVT